jgi:hypothetical protein
VREDCLEIFIGKVKGHCYVCVILFLQKKIYWKINVVIVTPSCITILFYSFCIFYFNITCSELLFFWILNSIVHFLSLFAIFWTFNSIVFVLLDWVFFFFFAFSSFSIQYFGLVFLYILNSNICYFGLWFFIWMGITDWLSYEHVIEPCLCLWKESSSYRYNKLVGLKYWTNYNAFRMHTYVNMPLGDEE